MLDPNFTFESKKRLKGLSPEHRKTLVTWIQKAMADHTETTTTAEDITRLRKAQGAVRAYVLLLEMLDPEGT